MKTRYWGLVLSLILVLGSGIPEVPAADEHIPEGITMRAGYSPGIGEPLGIFTKTIGRVALIHSSDPLGYWAADDLPLYMKDRVITPEEGLALLQFLDDSTISVAEDSELIINRFIFDPDKFDRTTFLSLNSGRSRFWVKKFQDFARSEFKVKTKTIIAGVRGSDFIIEANARTTQITTLDDTELEVVSLAAPDRTTVLRSFERVRVNAGEPASKVEGITPEEAARLRQELPIPADRSVMDAAGVFRPDGSRDVNRRAVETAPVSLISREDLVEPVRVGEIGGPEPGQSDEWFDRSLPEADVARITDQAREVMDAAIEEDILSPLPELPETP